MVACHVIALVGTCLVLLAIGLSLMGVHPAGWLPWTATLLTFLGFGGRYVLGQTLAKMLVQDSERSLTTIYMPLLNQEPEACRPVEAMKVTNLGYMVTEGPEPGEQWAFQPGHILRCEHRRFGGQARLVAVGKAT